MTSVQLKEMRLRSGQSRQKMADLLGYTANYIYLLESGRKPITDELARRVSSTLRSVLNERSSNSTGVREEHAAYGACRIPADCDLPAQLNQVRAELRDVKGKLDTLLGLLGGPLRSAIGLDESNPDKRVG